MIGRVTAQLTANIARENLQANLARLNALTEMASSQRRISRPSDDPIGAGQAMRARSDLRAAEQHVRNADNGIGWLRQRCCPAGGAGRGRLAAAAPARRTGDGGLTAAQSIAAASGTSSVTSWTSTSAAGPLTNS